MDVHSIVGVGPGDILVAVARGISLPLVQTMMAISIRSSLGTSGLVAHSSISMVSKGRSIVAGISLPLVETMMTIAMASSQSLGAPVCVARTSIGMVSTGSISKSSLCSCTSNQSKYCDDLCCHGVLPS